MLTRLKVSGFKNLVDVEVHFGPFTCIAGANGVGKSNLFDAILLLGALTERTLTEALLAVRDESQRTGDTRGVFHRVGDVYDAEMKFEAEMILPKQALDDLGQRVDASITFVRYVLRLGRRREDSPHADAGPVEVLEETLEPIPVGEAPARLAFPMNRDWRGSVLEGRRAAPFISTEKGFVRMHQDMRSGRLLTRPAVALPRTMLSTVQTGEYPTALVVRREMLSWRLLQFESSALRRPAEFTAPPRMGADGSHLAATLYHLAARPHPRRHGPSRARSLGCHASIPGARGDGVRPSRERTDLLGGTRTWHPPETDPQDAGAAPGYCSRFEPAVRRG